MSILNRHRDAAVEIPELAHIIAGAAHAGGSAGSFEHINPTTAQVQMRVPLAGAREVDAAVAAANAAFPAWRGTSPEVRRQILQRLAELIGENAERFARLSALEFGGVITFTRFLAVMAQKFTNYYAGWADRLEGQVVTHDEESGFVYTIPEPLGAIAVIVTWNGPIISLGMKVIPALAAGNTVVLKPAEIAPFSSQLFMELAQQAGVPDGVINLVHGGGEAGTALTGHPGIAKITFTGGHATAHRILEAAARNLTPAVLELGGKSANLVFGDADLEAACAFTTLTGLANAGQGCALPTRVLVEDGVYSDFVARLEASVSSLSVGDPLADESIVGPVISRAASERILGIVDEATSTGAGRVVTGGKRLDGELAGGWFLAPTVLADVDPNSSVAQKEIFGPVISVMRFKSEEEAVALANGTGYGLSSYIQSGDAGRVRRLIGQLRSGTVGVNGGAPLTYNAPFGGLGLSGYGKEGGKAGIDEFLHLKTVLVR
ncbi:aldehyde dehydrogenase (NAD+) [Sphingobium sp. OAS761]|uniref:aldehyde dehydrogenase family protein n=1 Tax=Sphingobium sp. OAS761 TaxID=2817901 RepID=UPI0020A20065|nr:aldehyde dehydrogenase family protein [Sphingobium sp. OAS761]MCP1472387.1 aldehyde dehydrogenase (NAD+) [Sphingobium sp. OAS761]